MPTEYQIDQDTDNEKANDASYYTTDNGSNLRRGRISSSWVVVWLRRRWDCAVVLANGDIECLGDIEFTSGPLIDIREGERWNDSLGRDLDT
jgi:hypothetical protein